MNLDQEPVESIIARWVALAGDEAKPHLADWERRILDLLVPASIAEIDAACVSCGVRDVARETFDGVVMTRALRFVRDRVSGETVEARCISCGESWSPDQFMWLAKAIGAGE